MDEMRQTVGNALILTALISAVMTAVSMTGMHALLKFMHTPDDIFKDAYAYVMIICGGILPRHYIISWPVSSVHWETVRYHCIF